MTLFDSDRETDPGETLYEQERLGSMGDGRRMGGLRDTSVNSRESQEE